MIDIIDGYQQDYEIVAMTDTNTRDIFMVGFAYGCRYGYEGIYKGRMKDDEIKRSTILSGCLFDETEGIVEPEHD